MGLQLLTLKMGVTHASLSTTARHTYMSLHLLETSGLCFHVLVCVSFVLKFYALLSFFDLLIYLMSPFTSFVYALNS
jgi:hypothetical protein